MKINITNKKLLNSLYTQCTLLNYINNYKILKTNTLKYNVKFKNNTINYIKNFYKPSNYMYATHKHVKKLNKNIKSGVILISTSLGVITTKKAELLNLGGLLICYIS